MLCVDNRAYLESDHTDSNMPADYSSYLLSTSPPGFDLAYTLRDRYNEKKNKRKVKLQKANIFYSDSAGRDPFSQQELDEVSQGLASLLSDFQSHKSHSLPLAYTRFQGQTINGNTNNNNSDDGLKKKAVSFADELGKSLVEIRIVYENSDEPPSFEMPSEFLSTVAEGAQAGISDAPPLSLHFAQPASNYKNFRAKLENNCVSLENVIVKEYNLLGTVKVKNIAFEKKVKVRYTCDSWSTLCDVDAQYVPAAPSMPGTSASVPYDTFSFQLSIPPNFDPNLKIQFSICYEANGQQFWDSNDGKNYEVVSANRPTPREKTQDNGVYDLHHDDKWTEFSNWAVVDTSIPYW